MILVLLLFNIIVFYLLAFFKHSAVLAAGNQWFLGMVMMKVFMIMELFSFQFVFCNAIVHF